MKQSFSVPLAPPQISYPSEKLEYMRRGANAHGAFKDNLTLSCDWKARANGCEVPVYATPITHGGPHSFCQILSLTNNDLLEITLTFAHELHSAKLFSENEPLEWSKNERNITFRVKTDCTITVEVNERIYMPITVFVRPPLIQQDKNHSDAICFGPGYHEVDFLNLESGKKIYIDAEAVVHATAPSVSEIPKIEKDWAGKANYTDFISATNCADLEIYGYGILDLSELDWHARRTLCFSNCSEILINGPIMIGAAHWTVALFECKNVTLENLALFGYRENSDGLDIVNCENVHVNKCFIRTGDDGVCVKSMKSPPVCGGKNILVENCTVWNDKVRALSIAGESKSDISDVVFRNCKVLHGLADWANELGALCIVLCDSGTVKDVVYENITIYQESAQAINCILFKDQWSTDIEVGHIRNAVFRNIILPKNSSVRIWGYNEMHCVENIKLENIICPDNNIIFDCNDYTKNVIL